MYTLTMLDTNSNQKLLFKSINQYIFLKIQKNAFLKSVYKFSEKLTCQIRHYINLK